MNRVLALAVSVPKTCVRRLSTTEIKCAKTDLAPIKKKQAHFQADYDAPMYLKGGGFDYVLYFGTLGLIVFSLASGIHSIYQVATKK